MADLGNTPVSELDVLAHHGIKGMKWGVRRAEKVANRRSARAAVGEDLSRKYTSDAHKGRRWVSAYLTVGESVAYNYQRSSGSSKGRTIATTILAGPIGNVIVAEMNVRKAAKSK